MEVNVTFPCGSLSLEGILDIPPSTEPSPAVVVCHPHPLYGGNMQNNVVMAVAQGLAMLGWVTFRFNFRGVGKSEGYYNRGQGEQDDLRAAITYLETSSKINPQRIGLCGYSFGSTIVFPVAAADNRIQAVAGISPPVLSNILSGYQRPKLLLLGKKDTLIDIKSLTSSFLSLPDPKKLEVIAEADHFWSGREGLIKNIVSEFFGSFL